MANKDKKTKVFYRIFPSEEMKWDHIKILNDKRTIYIANLQELMKSKNGISENFWQFKTDGIFFNTAQGEIYKTVTESVIENAVEGGNVIIVSFGQTCSGKSITTAGLNNTYEQTGLIPKITEDLFKIKRTHNKRIQICFHVSYIEINKSHVSDLLQEYPSKIDFNLMKNITKENVNSEYDVLKLLFKGEARKEFIEGEEGYMSHLCSSVFTFIITAKNTDASEPYQLSSKLHIIDLAGVDTIGNLTCLLKQPFDVGKANLIKSDLEHFILFLNENIPEHIRIQQRMNGLIRYLGNTLSRESILRFVGHIRTSREDLPITLSMLRFGQLISGLKPKRRKLVYEQNNEIQIQYLKNCMKQVKNDKFFEAVLANKDLSTNINQERLQHMQRTVEEYLQNKTNELNIFNVAEAQTVLKVFKDICNKFEIEKEKAYQEGFDKALISAKQQRRISKSESGGSIKGKQSSSRRSSMKSRESLLTETLPKRGSNEKAISSTHKVVQETESKSSKAKFPVSKKNIKRPKSSSASINKRSSVSKKKSNASTSIDERKELRQLSVYETMLVPDNLPDQKEAWGEFMKARKAIYSKVLETYKNNESKAYEAYQSYLKEIKQLQMLKDIVEIRQKEVIEINMNQMFDKRLEYDSNGALVPTMEEEVCNENLHIAKHNLLQQQERLLTIKAEIKIYLNMRQDIKNTLNEEFEKFYSEKYKTVAANIEELDVLNEETKILPITEDAKRLESEQPVEVVEQHIESGKFEHLKHVMEKELRKKIRCVKNNTNWLNYLRPKL